MVSKKNKSKIWGFMPHIQGVPWDFSLPSSTLAFKVVLIKEFMNMKYDMEFKNIEYDLQNLNRNKKWHGTPSK